MGTLAVTSSVCTGPFLMELHRAAVFRCSSAPSNGVSSFKGSYARIDFLQNNKNWDFTEADLRPHQGT